MYNSKIIHIVEEHLYTYYSIEIQIRDIKEKYSDSIVLFRMGDFYEAFFEDAEKLAQILSITLTKRANVPMSGWKQRCDL